MNLLNQFMTKEPRVYDGKIVASSINSVRKNKVTHKKVNRTLSYTIHKKISSN